MSVLARVALVAGLLASTTLAGRAATQDPPPPTPDPPVVFRSAADLVVLHVNVFDGHADAVEGLPRESFQVFEDGRPQPITFFTSEDVPVAAGLVIDNSGSMIARRRMVVAGVNAFAASSHPKDELFTVVFNEQVRLGLPDGAPFTTSHRQVEVSLQRYPAGGLSAVYDAVIAALDHLDRATHQKQVLVVLSDGKDNASRHTKADMLERAAASDAIVYTVAKNDATAGGEGDPGVLRRLAEVTGGVAYFAATEDEVVRRFETIAANVRRGYSIGYEPPGGGHDGRFHTVKIEVRTPGRGTLRARTREGYAAPGPDRTR